MRDVKEKIGDWEFQSAFKSFTKLILALLQNLPRTSILTLDEYLVFIEKNKLTSKGLGFVDIHLLGSSILTGSKLFTYDKKLIGVAKSLSINFWKIS